MCDDYFNFGGGNFLVLSKSFNKVTDVVSMVEKTTCALQAYAFNARGMSPLFRLGASVLLMYICGIGIFLWSINLRCRIRDMTATEPLLLSSQSWSVEQRGNYLIIQNYVRAELTPNVKKTLTFACAATYSDLRHVPEVCRRWQGPMSISLYAPGSDFKASLRAVFQLRLEESSCVRQNVSWHFFYDSELGPAPRDIKSPEEEAGLSTAERWSAWPKSSFRSHVNLPFPANIGRNVALQQSRTKYNLLAELHFYPSVDIIPRFFKMQPQQNFSSKRVYVLPVFKMSGKDKPPEIKSELVRISAKGKVAIPIGTTDCTDCHVFPKASGWLDADSPNNTMAVYLVTKKEKDFASWQPYYISTRDIPLLEEEMTKEGRQDRLTQAMELCLLWYDFYILDNAFLVQVYNEEEPAKDDAVLQNFVLHNNKVRQKALEALTCRYGTEVNC